VGIPSDAASACSEFSLLFWNPALTRRDETHIHAALRQQIITYGEWHHDPDEGLAVIGCCCARAEGQACAELNLAAEITQADKEAAMATRRRL